MPGNFFKVSSLLKGQTKEGGVKCVVLLSNCFVTLHHSSCQELSKLKVIRQYLTIYGLLNTSPGILLIVLWRRINSHFVSTNLQHYTFGAIGRKINLPSLIT